MKNIIKNDKGAIIVEASISLPIFMFTIFTILSIINISIVQAKIQIAINSTAKEISQYSYLYGLTGLPAKERALYQSGQASVKKAGDVASGIFQVVDSMGELSTALEGTDVLASAEQAQRAIESGQEGADLTAAAAKSIAEDPAAFFLGLVKALGSDVLEEGKSKIIASLMAKGLVQKHLVSDSYDDPESYLKHLGVVPKGDSYLDGIYFGESLLFPRGTDDIVIIAMYRVQIIKLLNIDIQLDFVQVAKTKAWFPGASAVKIASSPAASETKPDASSSVPDGSSSLPPSSEIPPASSSTPKQLKSPNEYALDATRDNGYNYVMLGKHDPNGETGYIQNAQRFQATYFSLDDNVWNDIASEYEAQGKNVKDEMWKINEEFMNQQKAKGKTFVTQHTAKENGDTYFSRELAYLQALVDSGEYVKIEKDGIWYWEPAK